MEASLKKNSVSGNDFHSAFMRAYQDLYLSDIESGKQTGMVTPSAIVAIFKMYMLSPDSQSVKTYNSLLSAIGTVFQNLDLRSMCVVAGALAHRNLPQADVF